MALEQFFNKTDGAVNGLPVAKGEEPSLPCYFTPHFFAVETEDGILLSKEAFTLRQIIALLSENGYNYNQSKAYYSLKEINLEKKTKSIEKKATGKK